MISMLLQHLVFYPFITLILLLSLQAEVLRAQVVLDAELRPRTELRQGFKTLPTSSDRPAFFTEQRSRLSLSYSNDSYEVGISMQDVRIWGSEGQLTKSDIHFSVHEAWGKVFVGENSFIKVGRQELVYDDQRILGSVNWTAQGRSHDAVVAGTEIRGWDTHLGLAYNQDDRTQEPSKLFETFYSVSNNYKTLQYLWSGKSFDSLSASFLFLNNGLQAPDSTVHYSQTLGLNVNYHPADNVTVKSSFYYQTGRDGSGSKIAAYLGSLNVAFPVATSFTLTSGGDYLSGSHPDDRQNNSFIPLYGTHHAFYGFMDYFYVGHPHRQQTGPNLNNSGLIDLYLKSAWSLSSSTVVRLHLHHFLSPVSIVDPQNMNRTLSSSLGTEFDLVFGHRITEGVSLQAGYSQMMATSSMEVLKGGDSSAFSGWGWVMLSFNPTFYTSH